MKFRILIHIFSTVLSISASANYISGTITGADGQALPYANVYVKNSSYGVASNIKGHYFLELEPGPHTLIFSYIGYVSRMETVVISQSKPLTLNISLTEEPVLLGDFEVVAIEKDKAKDIMQLVRDNRRAYLDRVSGYSCKTYLKTSLEKELSRPRERDTLSSIQDTSINGVAGDIATHLSKEKLNLIESVTETYFTKPGRYKEIVLAHHDYIEERRNLDQSVEVSAGINYGPEDFAPMQVRASNPNIIYEGPVSCEFNFYENLIDYPGLCAKPLLSPIASTSNLSYQYRIVETFEEDARLVYKISVEPILKSEALFKGFIYIEDSTWALLSVDLSVNRAALLFCSGIRIIQNYEEVDSAAWLAVRRELTYTIRDGRYDILGNTRVSHNEYVINPEFPARFFNSEIKRYEVDAFDKDSSYWNSERTLVLEAPEMEFIRRTDSIQEYYVSDAYYHKIDSSFNHINKYWFWATGVGHRNRVRGNEYYISGVFEQVNFFGIGGYRHKLPGYYTKDFKNGYTLETRGFIDYGFRNKDMKGKVGIGLTYLPLRFVKTFVEVGDYYDQVNNYASIEQVFSRSNYVRTKTFSISQRMEIINGLYGQLTFEFSDQDPISDLQLSKWSELIFGELNQPTDFVRYKKAEIRLDMKYRFRQKYIIRKNRKIVIGTDYPEIDFLYRKGIPGFLGSEVDFDYLEIGAHYDMQLARFGSSRWRFLAGSFINKNNLRVLEYKYFRGSDRYFFSDPLHSFQLLGPTLNTPHSYLRANYIHHFEGTLLNKVPYISRLKLEVAAGAGTLLIPDSDFRHFEAFAGLERNIRIKGQLMRLGVYAVTSDNSLSSADYTIKFGIDFFNTFTNKWSY